MNPQNTVNAIDNALIKLAIIEEKLKRHPAILQGLKPNWPTAVRQRMERLKNCANTAIQWNMADASIWQNVDHHIQKSFEELKVNEIAQYEWADLKAIGRLFNEGWKSATAANSNYQKVLKIITETSALYLDPEINTSEIEKYRVRAEESDAEIQRLKKSLSEALRMEAVGQSVEPQSRFFEEIAEKCNSSSWRWLTLVFLLCLALAGIGVCEMKSKKDENITSQQLVTHVAGRVILITALFYFLRIASQNYRANEHNRIVNTHRAKALKIFSVLVKAVDDKSTQTVILTKAADAIFGHQLSGHDSNNGIKESTDFNVNVNTERST